MRQGRWLIIPAWRGLLTCGQAETDWSHNKVLGGSGGGVGRHSVGYWAPPLLSTGQEAAKPSQVAELQLTALFPGLGLPGDMAELCQQRLTFSAGSQVNHFNNWYTNVVGDYRNDWSINNIWGKEPFSCLVTTSTGRAFTLFYCFIFMFYKNN